ncbi:MAG: nucleotidyltransferase domain-containing protein [Candidatus Hodarchaeales archaeon]
MNQFNLLLKISKLMKDFNKPWYIAGGWAIDLFLGLVTRSHQDIEIIIFRNMSYRSSLYKNSY